LVADSASNFAGSADNWGWGLGELGRHAEALEKYQKAVELDPSYALAYDNWGWSLGALDWSEEISWQQWLDRVYLMDRYYQNGLRVLGTAERLQVDQCIRQQLHAIVPLLNMLKLQEELLELTFPRKGLIDTRPQGMDGGIEELLCPRFGGFAIAWVLFEVGDHTGVERDRAWPTARAAHAARRTRHAGAARHQA
jgi:tetratricopeptide (TPR) repeat protein